MDKVKIGVYYKAEQNPPWQAEAVLNKTRVIARGEGRYRWTALWSVKRNAADFFYKNSKDASQIEKANSHPPQMYVWNGWKLRKYTEAEKNLDALAD